MRIELPHDRSIELAQGDLTRVVVDAIVNAANPSLLGGGGVDGAIHRAGGPAILDECRALRRTAYPQGIEPGLAVATTAGDLAARYVIHTVGPVYHSGKRDEPRILAACYRNAIELADELALVSIAFPSISTGAFGYPVDEAAPIALRSVRDALDSSRSVRLARFVLFDRATLDVYTLAASMLERTH